jgi:signal transduction histidine kinase
MAPSRAAPPAKEALAYAGAWTALALVFAMQYGIETSATRPVDWPQIVGSSLLSWYSCGLAAVPLVLMVRRWPLTASHAARTAGLYAVAIALATVVRFAIYVPLRAAFGGPAPSLLDGLRSGFVPEFATLAAVVGIVLALEYYRTGRAREMQAAQLEAELAQARFDALNLQLHPHFLFNTLNAIATLMHRDVDKADDMLARLSEMLRMTLGKGERQEIALADELAIVERYLDIMNLRFSNRLSVDIDVPSDLRSARVPSLVLQPLVENVVRHGLDERVDATRVRIAARASGETLHVDVVDNGRGLPPEGVREGIGLSNTRRRLEHLYGDRGRLSVANAATAGVEVRLSLPLRTTT